MITIFCASGIMGACLEVLQLLVKHNFLQPSCKRYVASAGNQNNLSPISTRGFESMKECFANIVYNSYLSNTQCPYCGLTFEAVLFKERFSDR